MKNLFIAALALAAVACTKSEVLETAPQKAISFGKPFVENSTKAIDPSLTETTLESFKVYGTLTNSNNQQTRIFDGTTVYKSTATDRTIGKTWFYEDAAVQYWIPGNKYNFAALANATVKSYSNELPATVSYTADGESDLLYAKSAADITTGDTGFNSDVEFTFDHLLSKVKFTFVNGYPADSKIIVKVSNVKITDAFANGVCALADKTWVQEGSNKIEMEFGNIVEADTKDAVYELPSTGAFSGSDWTTDAGFSSKYEKLLIPGQSEFNVTFTAQVLLNGIVVNSYSGSTVTVQGGLQPGYSYNFVGTIGQNLEKITFSVEKINGFTPATPQGVELN